MIFLLLLQGERCRRGFLTRGCSAAFTEAVEAVSAKAKSFLLSLKVFQASKLEAGQLSLLSFLRLSDPRGVDHEAVRRSRGCTVPILLLVYAACVYASLLRGNSINAAADAQWFQIAKTRQNFNFENS